MLSFLSGLDLINSMSLITSQHLKTFSCKPQFTKLKALVHESSFSDERYKEVILEACKPWLLGGNKTPPSQHPRVVSLLKPTA